MEQSEPKLTFQDLLAKEDQSKLDDATNLASSVKRGASKVPPEDILLAEFGLYFGLEAIMAVRNNEITYNDMISIILGAREINSANRYNNIMDMRYALNADTKEFSKHLSEIRK